jgi:hypothetical protein
MSKTKMKNTLAVIAKAIPGTGHQSESLMLPLKPRAWQLAQLAATLAGQTTIYAKSDDPLTLRSVKREAMLESLVESANYLLIAAERITRRQHAYQLFAEIPTAQLTVNGIARVFKQNNWPQLKHNNSVEALLLAILRRLREFAGHVEQIGKSTIQKEQKEMEVEMAVSPCPVAHLDSISIGPIHNLRLLEGIWIDPDELVSKKTPKRYWAERIFRIADLFGFPEFEDKLVRTV